MNASARRSGRGAACRGRLLLGGPAHGAGLALVGDRAGGVVLAHVELPLAGHLRPRAVGLAAGRAAEHVERAVVVVEAQRPERGVEAALLQRQVAVVVRVRAVAAAALELEPDAGLL